MANGPSLDEYQIGWICSHPIVADASEQMLDEKYGPLEGHNSADTNIYTLGRVGKHFVVIVCVGGQQHGTTPATVAAIHMMRTFPVLRKALVVSIGGGIPSQENDVRLGDVVVSHPTDTCGGIVKYDLTRTRDGETHERTIFLNHPPRMLLAAVARMRAACLRNEPLFPEYMAVVSGQTARTQRIFMYPGEEHDRLFSVEREHIRDAPGCQECLPEWEVERCQRETEPAALYGTIASGHEAIEHAATRDRIGQKTGALCIESIAAGVIQDLPCLVICGISSYADSHADSRWEGNAALAAAAYAKELLGYVPRSKAPSPNTMAAISRIQGEEQSRQNTDVLNSSPQEEWLKITKALTLSSDDSQEIEHISKPGEKLLHTRFDWVE